MNNKNSADCLNFYLSQEEIETLEHQKDLKELNDSFEKILNGLDTIYDKLDEIKEIETSYHKSKLTI